MYAKTNFNKSIFPLDLNYVFIQASIEALQQIFSNANEPEKSLTTFNLNHKYFLWLHAQEKRTP